VSLDPAIAGYEYAPIRRAYDERDTILYALGVGATELRHVYERDLEALPTFPVVPPFAALMLMEDELGVDLAKVLHGEQRLRLHRPVPARGELHIRAHVSALWDKGPHAIIDTTAEVEVDGEHVATAVYSTFVRDGGGFGGERGSGMKAPAIDRAPDVVITERTLAHQAQIYRLSGDRNPLHVDPEFAARAGFERPILHGLCTYGFAVRMAMDALGGAVSSAGARFTGVVFGGDALTLELWHCAPGRAYGRVTVAERGAVVIDPLELSTTPTGAVRTGS
jgi:acyl dehydratase